VKDDDMAKHSVDDIRTIALAGHATAGKTTLADTLLFHAKAVDRRGSVEDGSSVSDFDEEEKKKGFSIDTSVLHLDHAGKHVYLLDTPGYPDFVGAALGALNAVENVAIVVSAPNGIQVNTRRMFKEAGKQGLARILVLNKLDAENIDFEGLLEALRATFGKGCVLFNVPDALGPSFKSVVSVLNPPASAPADCPVDLEAARAALIEAVVECDDSLTEKYFEGSITADDVVAALPKAIAAGTVVPIFCTSAKKDIGVAELLGGLVSVALSPAQGKKRKLTKGSGDSASEVELVASESGEFVAQVFKTLSDKFVGTMCFLRVLQGKTTPDQPLVNARSSKSARVSALLHVQGKQTRPIEEVVPGDIIAVTKVEDLHIGDTLLLHAGVGKMGAFTYPLPMFGLAVEPKARGDEQKISGSLQRIADEDPTFRVTRDTQTKELVITGMSQLHLDIIRDRLKLRFDLEIITHEPKIPYRETVTTTADENHRHKKQSGGRGQFGEVHLRVYPLPREITTQEELEAQFANKERFEKLRLIHYDPDYNFAFLDTVVGGTIPNQFIPAVEKGCRELLDRGVWGYRLQDVAVEVYFGKDHPVDSSEQAFKTAGRIAFKKAVMAARPVLLEPIVDLEVTFPTKYAGDILKNLNGKHGTRIEGQDGLPGDLTVIKAKVPLAEVTRYAAELGSITQGQGFYTMEFSHYEQVPGQVQKQITDRAKVTEDEDEE
jgi:elongation factor G